MGLLDKAAAESQEAQLRCRVVCVCVCVCVRVCRCTVGLLDKAVAEGREAELRHGPVEEDLRGDRVLVDRRLWGGSYLRHIDFCITQL